MKLRALRDKLVEISKTTRGKNILTFLVFLVISTLFWFLMALNDRVQRSYEIPIQVVDIPEGVTLLSDVPNTLDVTVKDKGRALIRYDWGSAPTLMLRYKDFAQVSEDRLLVSEQQLNNFIREKFGSSAEVVSSKPDSISVRFTTLPGEKLPLFVDLDAQSAPQFIIYDKPVVPLDSVTVFSANGIPSKIISVSTERVSLRNLTDSTKVELKILAPLGMRVVPSRVSVTIPVQPLISKKRSIQVTTKNVPSGVNMLTFPASVEINYLLPMSLYSTDDYLPVATADYRKIDAATTTVPIEISNIPAYYRSLTSTPEKVEYIIENKANVGNDQ